MIHGWLVTQKHLFSNWNKPREHLSYLFVVYMKQLRHQQMWFSQSQRGGRTVAPILVSRHPEWTVPIIWYPTATLSHTTCFNTYNSAKVMSPEQGIQHFQSYFVRIFILTNSFSAISHLPSSLLLRCWFQPETNLVALSANQENKLYQREWPLDP